MKFVIVNDDGIEGLGYQVLANILSKYGEVVVIVPDTHCSAKSHSVTLHKEFTLKKIHDKPYILYTLDGFPADCARFAHYIAKDADIFFSGINDGVNLGLDTLYSGTVAAAKEAALLGHRSIALSCDNNAIEIKEDIEVFIKKIIFENIYDDERLINVNFPKKGLKTNGINKTKLGGYIHNDYVIKLDDGKYRYNNSTDYKGTDDDVEAFMQGFISVTPLLIDITKK